MMSASEPPLGEAEKGVAGKEAKIDDGKDKTKSENPGRPSCERYHYVSAGVILLSGLVLFAILFPVLRHREGRASGAIKGVSVDADMEAKKNLASDANTNPTDDDKDGSLFPGLDGPYPARLRLFNEDTIRGYDNETELVKDLENAAWFLISNVVMRILGGEHGMGGIGSTTSPVNVGSNNNDPNDDHYGTNNNNDPNDDHYGTNNQEEGVEEGDLIVSDGEKVYAAYGDQVVAWEARSGRTLDSVRMPSAREFEAAMNGQKIAPPGRYYSRPNIRSLLVYKDKLLVIVSGYSSILRSKYDRVYNIMDDFMGTQVRIYSTSSLNDAGSFKLMGTKNINGRFSAVRAVNNNVHVVTTTRIDAYSELIQPFQRWHFERSDDAYIERVRTIAAEYAIPSFVNGLLEELKAPTGKVPNLAKISLWQTESTGGPLERKVFADGIINNLMQVFSFDVMADADNALSFEVSGSFLPSSWAQVYGAEKDLIIAGEGWEYNGETRTSMEATYLIGMATDGPSTKLRSVGHLVGHVMNSYAMDVAGNTLRIATTVRNMWFLRPIEPIDDGVISPFNEDFLVEPESTTKNFVTLLEMPDMDNENSGSVMRVTGRLKLGKPNEVFTAVRFFDNVAYAVTFERTDPFYVLNLTDPTAPEVLAELNITGFSSYLHPMNSDNSLILAIGQEADNQGSIEGIKVTVFDARVPENPVAIQNYVVERNRTTYSGSEALSNFKAARYAYGRLIIPLDIYDWQEPDNNFRGFVVFIANEDTVEEECRISHGERKQETSSGYRCYYCASLPRRSMIFDGLLMTTDKHIVQSTNTSTCQTVWTDDIVVSDPWDSCCGW